MILPKIPKTKAFASIVLALLCLVLVASIQPAKAQVVLAEWEYDDGYGQGIEYVYVHENSTGSFVAVDETAYNETNIYNMNYTASTALKITPYVTLNHTRQGLAENASAFAIMRVSIEVWIAGNMTFSQQNLTWSDSVVDATPTSWRFSCWVIVPMLIVGGTIYIVVLTYDIYEVIDL